MIANLHVKYPRDDDVLMGDHNSISGLRGSTLWQENSICPNNGIPIYPKLHFAGGCFTNCADANESMMTHGPHSVGKSW